MGKMKLALLFGGASKDHSASLMSAYSVLNSLQGGQYNIVPIGITKVGRWLFFPGSYEEIIDGTWEANPDCCSAVISPDPIHKGIIKILDDGNFSLQRIDKIFSVVHGRYGECGRIQALCKLSGIPYVGSGLEASVACTDRMLTHLVLNRVGIKTAKYYSIERIQMDILDCHLSMIEEGFNYPLYVKAANCSRSIGINRVNDSEELRNAIKIAFSHHHKVIVEEEMNGREFECIVFGSDYNLRVSEIGELIEEKREIKSKHIVKAMNLITADLNSDVRERITKEAKLAFKAFDCKGFARVSFKLNDSGLYCTGVGNMTGFTEVNPLSVLMQKSGFGYRKMLETIIDLA